VKPVEGFLLQVGQGKELPLPIKMPFWSTRLLEPESFYVVHINDVRGTHIEGGPYPTEERAFGDVWAITDTSGT
jgi:hypothetical protein